jgi:hypothetical protein
MSSEEQLSMNPELMALWRASFLGRNLNSGNVVLDMSNINVPLSVDSSGLGKAEHNTNSYMTASGYGPEIVASYSHHQMPLKGGSMTPARTPPKELTLEELFRDHDIHESTTTLESSIDDDVGDQSGSDLSGIFDDEDDEPEGRAYRRTLKRSSGARSSASSVDSSDSQRFKPFHEEKWSARLKELMQYRQDHGDCLVPHTYSPNPQLARWVKRQRRQYKLMVEGRASTMTRDRLDILKDIGFVWDSHDAAWQEKLNDLVRYCRENGNCLVPSNYKKNPQLATWVKCQRRQYKLYWEGRASAMTPERIIQLEKIGFEWEIRSSGYTGLARSDYIYLSEAISKIDGEK